jgi:hypothetical protein
VEGDVAYIALQNRRGDTVSESIIDAADIDKARQYRWNQSIVRTGSASYAATSVMKGGKPTTLYLHRLIMDAAPGSEIDHINMNGMDNRRSNLRFVSRSQNIQNKVKANRHSRSGVKNCFLTRSGTYLVRVRVDGVYHRLGTFKTVEEAESVASAARKRLHSHCRENSIVQEAAQP